MSVFLDVSGRARSTNLPTSFRDPRILTIILSVRSYQVRRAVSLLRRSAARQYDEFPIPDLQWTGSQRRNEGRPRARLARRPREAFQRVGQRYNTPEARRPSPAEETYMKRTHRRQRQRTCLTRPMAGRQLWNAHRPVIRRSPIHALRGRRVRQHDRVVPQHICANPRLRRHEPVSAAFSPSPPPISRRIAGDDRGRGNARRRITSTAAGDKLAFLRTPWHEPLQLVQRQASVTPQRNAPWQPHITPAMLPR